MAVIPDSLSSRTNVLLVEYAEKKADLRHSLALLMQHLAIFVTFLFGTLGYVLLATPRADAVAWGLFFGDVMVSFVGWAVCSESMSYVAGVERRLFELSLELGTHHEPFHIFARSCYGIFAIGAAATVLWFVVLLS